MRYEYFRKPRKCPNCGSPRIAKIVYGLINVIEISCHEQERKLTIPGGCVVSEDDPAWQCYECGVDIYQKPHLKF